MTPIEFASLMVATVAIGWTWFRHWRDEQRVTFGPSLCPDCNADGIPVAPHGLATPKSRGFIPFRTVTEGKYVDMAILNDSDFAPPGPVSRERSPLYLPLSRLVGVDRHGIMVSRRVEIEITKPEPVS